MFNDFIEEYNAIATVPMSEALLKAIDENDGETSFEVDGIEGNASTIRGDSQSVSSTTSIYGDGNGVYFDLIFESNIDIGTELVDYDVYSYN